MSEYNAVSLFADECGGQNKNAVMITNAEEMAF